MSISDLLMSIRLMKFSNCVYSPYNIVMKLIDLDKREAEMPW